MGWLSVAVVVLQKPDEEVDVIGAESEAYEGGAKLPEADGLV